MAQNSNRPGLHGGNRPGNNTGGNQSLIIAPSGNTPPAPPPPGAPSQPWSGWKILLGLARAIWNNKAKTAVISALAITGGTALYSAAEVQVERPHISLFSFNGLSGTVGRTWSNMFDRVVPTIWDYTGGAVGKAMIKLNPVSTRYKPYDYAVVCKSTSLIQQINRGDAQAIAFDESIKPQLAHELHLLGTVDAPFYQRYGFYNPDRQVAIAKFKIPDVRHSFTLTAPTPLSEWQIESAGGPCGENETFERHPIPRLQKAQPE